MPVGRSVSTEPSQKRGEIAREHPRITLGLLIDWLEDDYQNTVLSGIADAARERDVNLICFAGGVLESPHRFGAQRNVIFDLAGPENVDGLMIMSGTLENYRGRSELLRFCERYRPLPMCSIAVALPGIASVLVDNATGMREAIVHLIEVHSARRIAFIRGPEVNEESERRYRVYREVLSERDITIDPNLIAVGDFQQDSGMEAIRVIYDERGARVDAVVAASDYMALGAMKALALRGIRVPEDVAVVGFDDVDEARFALPPLTTVRQPLYEQGKRAAEILLSLLSGAATPEPDVLHTGLVIRRSCGCGVGSNLPVDSAELKKLSHAEIGEALRILEHSARSNARQRLHVQRWARALADIGQVLLTTFDIDSLVSAVAEQFPRLGIASCYLALYKNEKRDRSRLVLSYAEKSGQGSIVEHKSFVSRALVPGGMLSEYDRHTFIVEPLFFKREQLGFALFEMGPPEGVIYEALRDQISGALKGALLVQQVVDKDRERQRLLRYIVDVTPDMHKLQPLEDLFQNILGQVTGLLGAVESPSVRSSSGSIPPPPSEAEGFLAITEEDGDLVVRARTPRFGLATRIEDCLDREELELVLETMRQGRVRIALGSTIVPLRVGDVTLGVIYLDCPAVSEQDVELLKIFSNQATAAIQNMQLYEMAALDPLTGVQARRFFEHWLRREVRTAFRGQHPLSLLMIDMDGMKIINDTAGHPVGDQALSTMGKVLRQATRENDVVGRYGGDEFGIVLPHTDALAAERVGRRVLELLHDKFVWGPSGERLALHSSIGQTTLAPHALPLAEQQLRVSSSYFQSVAQAMVRNADEALYRVKKLGGAELSIGAPTAWDPADAN